MFQNFSLCIERLLGRGRNRKHFPSLREPSGVSATHSKPATGFALTLPNSSSKSWIAFGVIDMGESVHTNTASVETEDIEN
jgi:hypothetical protein